MSLRYPNNKEFLYLSCQIQDLKKKSLNFLAKLYFFLDEISLIFLHLFFLIVDN
jgi:hypothetical protein